MELTYFSPFILGHRGSVLTAILHEINAVLVSFQTPSKCFTQRTQGNKELMYPLDIRILFLFRGMST